MYGSLVILKIIMASSTILNILQLFGMRATFAIVRVAVYTMSRFGAAPAPAPPAAPTGAAPNAPYQRSASAAPVGRAEALLHGAQAEPQNIAPPAPAPAPPSRRALPNDAYVCSGI
jgi:hypothetical protein